MPLSSPESLTYSVPTQAECLLHIPADPHTSDLLVLTLHGYGMNAQSMLDLTLMLVGSDRIVASLQGPNQFYQELGKPRTAICYNWGTHRHSAANIRLHHDMVRSARSQLQDRYHIGPERTLLIGFSQSVGFGYRFAGTYPGEIGGVIGICGGVPRDGRPARTCR